VNPGPHLDPGGERDDLALLDAHITGDPAAFGELFARHRNRLWAVALRTTGNPEDAADALQDALISAFKRAESFRGDSAVTTWLHRIVVNACLDRMRRAKVRLADPLPEDPEDRASLDAVAGAGPVDDPEAHVLAGDRKERVFAALGELHADQRAALVLVDMEGYPVQEAARILEVPPGTIKSRCARGRARLALLLADLDTEAGESRHGTIGGPAASYSGDPPRGARPTADPPSDPPGPARWPDSGNRPHQHADPREEVSGHE
jgi:RNA polymerase sigma-70 factor (ECF subfamily)